MRRRTLLLSTGGLLAGAGAVVSSGAFSSVTAERSVSISTAGDDSAFLTLTGPSEYVNTTNGMVRFTLGGEGPAFNENAVTTLEDVLTITNNAADGSSTTVGVSTNQPSASPTPNPTATVPVEEGEVTFYVGSVDAPSVQSLPSGGSATLDVVVDTTVGGSDASTGSLTIVAADGTPSGGGGGGGGGNAPPTAADDSYTTDEGTQLSVSAPGVLSNDDDPDGDALTPSVASGPANGSLALDDDGSFTYTPDAGYSGQDSFRYRVEDGNGHSASAMATITVDAATDTSGRVAFTQNGQLRSISSDGKAVTEWNRNSVEALGPIAADFDGDGNDDVPYLKNKNSLRLIDSDDAGPRTINLAPDGKADTQKTTLAVGSWNGSSTSIFYAGQNHERIYRVAPAGTGGPTLVFEPESGVDVVLGFGDVDGDGSNELVFVGGSQRIRYVDPDGTTHSTGVTAGSSNNVGAGAPAVFGGGAASVPVVNGSNEIILVGANGIRERVITGSDSEQAAKSAVAPVDVDGDSAPEIVYLENNNSPAHLKYVDDVGATNQFEFLVDDEGDRIEADKKRGVV